MIILLLLYRLCIDRLLIDVIASDPLVHSYEVLYLEGAQALASLGRFHNFATFFLWYGSLQPIWVLFLRLTYGELRFFARR